MLSPEHRKALKIAAVVLCNVATVWWLTKALKVNLRELIAGVEIVALILAPLFALHLRSQWPTKSWLASAVLLPMLWFATLFSTSAIYVVSRILVLYKDCAQLEPPDW